MNLANLHRGGGTENIDSFPIMWMLTHDGCVGSRTMTMQYDNKWFRIAMTTVKGATFSSKYSFGREVLIWLLPCLQCKQPCMFTNNNNNWTNQVDHGLRLAGKNKLSQMANAC